MTTLTLRSDGPLPWTGGHGTLRVTIVDPAGQPAEASVTLFSRDPRVSHETLHQDVEGSFEREEVEAVLWLVQVSYQNRSDKEVEITRLVPVPTDGVGAVTVTVVL